jgi:hypothetical protein
VSHPKLVCTIDACVIVSPDHGRVFRQAGWSRTRLRAELGDLLAVPADELIQGVDGIAEGVPEHLAGRSLPKFREDGLLLAYAGGQAGLFSAIVEGWVGGAGGSIPVTREVVP